MNTFDLILSIITAILGGSNILQIMNNRALRKKMQAEGDQEVVKSLQLVIEGNVAEIARLQKAYGDLQDKYFKLANDMIELRKLLGK